MMLGYYRNPLNFVFFNESIIVCALMSFGHESDWKQGVDINELYKRVQYLAELLKREEVLFEYLSGDNRGLYESKLKFMQD